MNYRLFIAIAAIAALAGCGKESTSSKWRDLKPGVYVAEKSVAIKDMTPSDVLYFVNGEKITKADFDERFALESTIFKLRREGSQFAPKALKNYIAGIKKNIPSHLVQRKLFLQAAGKAGVKADEKAVAKLNSDFLKGLPRRPKEGELEKKLGSEVFSAYKKSLEEDAIIAEYRAKYWTNSFLTVSEEAISNKWAEVLRVNAKADKMNAKTREKALEFKQKVLEGGDFGELTQKYAKVHPEYGTNWVSAVLADFSPEEDIYKWLVNAKTGDISEPLEMDDGLAIVKLVSRHRADLPKALKPEDEFTMVRCTFYIFNKYEEGTTPELIRKVFLDEQLKKAHGELGVKLWHEAVIELPNGEDFFKGKSSTKAQKESK